MTEQDLTIVRSSLRSLGINFPESAEKKAQEPADPERTILDALACFYGDRKTFSALLGWLPDFAPLIHVERLVRLSSDLPVRSYPVLCGLSEKMIRLGDRRFGLVTKAMNKKFKAFSFTIRSNENVGGSLDPDFLKFGIKLEIDSTAPETGLIDKPEAAVTRHPWLKLRALVGANFRADLIYFMANGTVENANQAIKRIGCSRETAYRLWREVSLYRDLDRLL